MKLELCFGATTWRADTTAPLEIAHPVRTGGDGPRAFFLDPAESAPVRAGGFVGDVREGGSVNCERLTLFPHGNGTHTECVGHVLTERVSVAERLPPALLFAVVLRVKPRPFAEVKEAYEGKHEAQDLVVSGADLRAAFDAIGGDGLGRAPEAVIVATGVGARDFSGTNPPYLTLGAIDFLLEVGVDHVLTDLPSIDREDDGGALCCHRRLWGLYPGQKSLFGQAPSHRTVTELCSLPDDMKDGPYLLLLQVPALDSDAAPSRPVLFALDRVALDGDALDRDALDQVAPDKVAPERA